MGVSTESTSFRSGHFDELRALAASQLQKADKSVIRSSWARLLWLVPQAHWQAAGPLPVLIEATDWALIESGLVQRAQLLQAILDDAYGAEELTQRGLLPQALVRGHPGYLRPARTSPPRPSARLRLLAFDLVRDPQGHWQVLGQQTQAPQGLGMLWRQRERSQVTLASTLADLGVRSPIEAIAHWMQGLRSAESAAAELAPRWVMLGGDTFEKNIIDDALAVQLDLIPARGDDLLIRQACLYLKSLGGLLPVHGLLASLADEQIDPLELRADCSLGVPGLLQALRAGHVTISNSPGTGFLESPALAGFMPGLSRALRGEELLLPDRASWWCGETAALDNAGSDLSQYSVIQSHPNRPAEVTDLAHTDSLTIWAQRLRENGEAYTLQHRLRPSLTPQWEHGELQLCPMTLRVFAVLGTDHRWCVVPGALARLSLPDGALGAELHAEAWVLGGSSAPPEKRVKVTAPTPILARRADDIFWLGRYLTRAEMALRATTLAYKLIESPCVSPAQRAWLDSLLRLAALVPEDTPSALIGLHHLPEALAQDLQHARLNGIRFNLHAMAERVARLHAHLPQALQQGLEAARAQWSGSQGPWNASGPPIDKDRGATDRSILQIRAFFAEGAWHRADAALFGAGLLIERLSLWPRALADACACAALSESSTRQALDQLLEGATPHAGDTDEHQWLRMRLEFAPPGSWAQHLTALRQQIDTIEEYSAPGACLEGALEALAGGLRSCRSSIDSPPPAALAQALRVLAESSRAAGAHLQARYFGDRAAST